MPTSDPFWCPWVSDLWKNCMWSSAHWALATWTMESRICLGVPAAHLYFIIDSPLSNRNFLEGKNNMNNSFQNGWNWDHLSFCSKLFLCNLFPGNLHVYFRARDHPALSQKHSLSLLRMLQANVWSLEGGIHSLKSITLVPYLLVVTVSVKNCKKGRAPISSAGAVQLHTEERISAERQKQSCESQMSQKDKSLVGKDWHSYWYKIRLLRIVFLSLASSTILKWDLDVQNKISSSFNYYLLTLLENLLFVYELDTRWGIILSSSFYLLTKAYNGEQIAYTCSGRTCVKDF